VEGAEIRIFPVDYLPQAGDALAKAASGPQAYRAHTDAEGHYSLPAVAPGLYNVLAMRDGDVSLRDSIFLPAQAEWADTLRAAASLKGRVGVEPGDDPRGFAVQVVGLPYRAWLDIDGKFSLAGLPPGRLRLRIAREGSPDYREGNLDVTLARGGKEILDEPIDLVYLNVPAVKDFKVVMDTAAGIAKLTWSRPASPLIDHFVVIRDGSPLYPYSPNWITVEDTVFYDTLFPAGRIISSPGYPTDIPVVYPDTFVAKVQYRVAAAGRNDATGAFTGKLKVEAPPPGTVTTRFAFGDDSLPFVLLPIGQTGRLSLSFANPGRKVKKLEWKDAKGQTLRSQAFDAKKGRDSLEIDPPAAGDSAVVRVEATDASGHVWKDSLLVIGAPWKRLADRPLPAYGRAGRFQVDQPMLTVDGKIYVFGSQGAQSQTASNAFDPATGRWETLAEAPALGNAISVGGKAYVAAGDVLYAYDPARNHWDSVAALVSQGNEFAARPIFPSDGKIAIGSWQADYRATYFDPASGTSLQFPEQNYYSSPFTIQFTTARRAYLQFSGYNYYGYGYYGLVSYKWASAVLTNITTNTYAYTNNPVEINGFHYFVNASAYMTVFDEDRETFQSRVGPGFGPVDVYPYPPYTPQQVGVHVLGGRIFAFCLTRPGLVEVKSYLPGDRDWKTEAPIMVKGDHFATTEAGGAVYVLGYYGKGSPRADENPALYEYRPEP
jgi:hypothetical protein